MFLHYVFLTVRLTQSCISMNTCVFTYCKTGSLKHNLGLFCGFKNYFWWMVEQYYFFWQSASGPGSRGRRKSKMRSWQGQFPEHCLRNCAAVFSAQLYKQSKPECKAGGRYVFLLSEAHFSWNFFLYCGTHFVLRSGHPNTKCICKQSSMKRNVSLDPTLIK